MIWYWLALCMVAALGWPLNRWRRDIARLRAAEAENAQLVMQLARIREDHQAQIAEWADRLREVTAIALCLDIEERAQ